MGTPDHPTGVEPMVNLDAVSFMLQRQIFRPLVRWTASGIIESDAADFVTSLVAAMRTALRMNEEPVVRLAGFEEFRQDPWTEHLAISSPDPKTIDIVLERPNPYLLDTMGDRWSDLSHLVSAGPFRLEWHDSEIGFRVVRNEAYRGRFTDNVVRGKFIRVPEDRNVQGFLNDDYDCVVLTNPDPAEVRHVPPEEVISGPLYGVARVFVSVGSRPFGRQEARQALAHGIDRDRLVDEVTGGLQVPAHGGLVPVGVIGHNPGQGMRFDPALARELHERYEEASMTVERGLRLERIRELDRLVTQEALSVPLYYSRGYALQRSCMRGLSIFPLYHGNMLDVTVDAH